MIEVNQHSMRRVTKRDRCPVCNSDSWCMRGRKWNLCMRIKSAKPKEMRDGTVGWLHPVDGDALPLPPIRKPEKPKPTDIALHNQWAPRARAWYVGASKVEAVQRLARELGVSYYALDELCVGWDGRCWTFPEKNGSGLIVAVKRRAQNGDKFYAIGGDKRAGLCYSDSLFSAPGPVLVVEGASDVAAGITMGLAVVGRPSHVGGVPDLTKLLKSHSERKVIVIAERDRKRHEDLPKLIRERHPACCGGCQACWPGQYGALRVADKLKHSLPCAITWRFVPGEVKDLRQWLVSTDVQPDNQEACFKLGRSLLRRLRG